ncbi:hypothetical protein LB504_010126, partial [Fusarium proliferatum]
MLVATCERPVQAISCFSSLLKGGVAVANLVDWQIFGVPSTQPGQARPGPGHPAVQCVHAPSMRISGVTLSLPQLLKIKVADWPLIRERWLARPVMQDRTCLAGGDSCTWTIRFDCSVYV